MHWVMYIIKIGRITKNGSEVNLSTVKSLAEKFDVEYVLKRM